MSVRKPPALATWLLRRLGCVAQTQSFLGDLAEQFAGGRSRSWYWRQALAAVAIGLARTARRHGLSFVAAIVSAYLLGRVFELVDPTLLRPIFNPLWWRDEPQGTTDFLLRFRFLLLVGVLHIGLCLFTGWLVTKVHRAHPRAVLLTFVALLSVGPLLWIVRLGFDLQGNLRFLQSFVQASLAFLGGSSLTLLGGLLGAQRGARAKASCALDRGRLQIAIEFQQEFRRLANATAGGIATKATPGSVRHRCPLIRGPVPSIKANDIAGETPALGSRPLW